MSKINSRQKGAAGEREFANLLKEHGFEDARRGQQYSGIEGEDVVGLPHIHIEVKRVENLNLYNAMEQSIEDAEDGEIPIVAHRKNRQDWQVTMRLEDFKEIKKSSKLYHTELKIVKLLYLDRIMKELSNESKIMEMDPLLIHGRESQELYTTMYFNEWIQEYKNYIKEQ